MTEAEWLAGENTERMSCCALRSPRANDRTCRLFVAAFWGHRVPRAREGVRTGLQVTVAVMEEWADTGELPEGKPWKLTGSLHRDARTALEVTVRSPFSFYWNSPRGEAFACQRALFHDIFGNPFRPVAFAPQWRTETALSLARQMYEARDFGAMPILADALQDAGCDNDDILAHCRDPIATHARGCWVVDLVLGKE